jgi:hypothetical protein
LVRLRRLVDQSALPACEASVSEPATKHVTPLGLVLLLLLQELLLK